MPQRSLGFETRKLAHAIKLFVDASVSREINENLSGVEGMAGIYLAGLIASYVYNVLMSIIGQGVQKRIRDELFDHLETLPISYFDRRGHGWRHRPRL